MAKQYNEKKSDFDEFDVPTKRRFGNNSEGLYRAQEIVSPYPIDNVRYEKNFSSHPKKYYKRDKDFTPEERSQILARVSEVGATRAADEFGTRRWVIMQWLDNLERFGAIDNPKQKNKKYKNKKRSFIKSIPQKTIIDNPEPEYDEEEKLEETTTTKNEANIPDFTNFEFKFDGLLQQEEQQEQPVQMQNDNDNLENQTEISSAKINLKRSEDFSLEERTKILALSDKIGIKNAAIQVHTKPDVIKYWKKCRKNSAKNQKVNSVVSLADENEILKKKLVDLRKQIAELTGEFLNSVGEKK